VLDNLAARPSFLRLDYSVFGAVKLFYPPSTAGISSVWKIFAFDNLDLRDGYVILASEIRPKLIYF
jgi:hypothetical protein